MKFKSSLAATMVPMAQADMSALLLNEQFEPALAPVIRETGPAVVNIATIGSAPRAGYEDPFGELLPQNPGGGKASGGFGCHRRC